MAWINKCYRITCSFKIAILVAVLSSQFQAISLLGPFNISSMNSVLHLENNKSLLKTYKTFFWWPMHRCNGGDKSCLISCLRISCQIGARRLLLTSIEKPKLNWALRFCSSSSTSWGTYLPSSKPSGASCSSPTCPWCLAWGAGAWGGGARTAVATPPTWGRAPAPLKTRRSTSESSHKIPDCSRCILRLYQSLVKYYDDSCLVAIRLMLENEQ